MRKGPFRVTPLIVMTIDDLESLETSIEHFSLRDLLRDYSASCDDRNVSLRHFIATSEYREKIYHNKSIASKALEMLDETMRKIFPNEVIEDDES